MNPDKAAAELKIIRQLMERPIRYSAMSGLSGILAGAAALAGLALDRHISRAGTHEQAFWINLVVWAGVFLAAFASATLLTHLRERRQHMPFWTQMKWRILRAILPPFVAGTGLTVIVAVQTHSAGSNQWGLIPAAWMLFYGVACWQVAEFSIVELRLMSVAFIVLGLLSAGPFQNNPYIMLGVSFGGVHVAYGIAVWARHGG